LTKYRAVLPVKASYLGQNFTEAVASVASTVATALVLRSVISFWMKQKHVLLFVRIYEAIDPANLFWTS